MAKQEKPFETNITDRTIKVRSLLGRYEAFVTPAGTWVVKRFADGAIVSHRLSRSQALILLDKLYSLDLKNRR